MKQKESGDGEVNQTDKPRKGGQENSINHSSDPLILLESGFATNKLLLGTNP